MNDKLTSLKRLYRLRVYLYAFNAFLSSLSEDEKFKFLFYKGFSAHHYCDDMIVLVERIISSYSNELSSLLFEDIEID